MDHNAKEFFQKLEAKHIRVLLPSDSWKDVSHVMNMLRDGLDNCSMEYLEYVLLHSHLKNEDIQAIVSQFNMSISKVYFLLEVCHILVKAYSATNPSPLQWLNCLLRAYEKEINSDNKYTSMLYPIYTTLENMKKGSQEACNLIDKVSGNKFLALPEEILIEVISYLDKIDQLFNVGTVCQTLNDICYKHLNNNIEINSLPDIFIPHQFKRNKSLEQSPSSRKSYPRSSPIKMCLDRIVSKKEITDSVRHLFISERDPNGAKDKKYATGFDRLLKDTIRYLEYPGNVIHLVFHNEMSRNIFESNVSYFTQLETFASSSFLESERFRQVVEKVVRNCPGLQSLMFKLQGDTHNGNIWKVISDNCFNLNFLDVYHYFLTDDCILSHPIKSKDLEYLTITCDSMVNTGITKSGRKFLIESFPHLKELSLPNLTDEELEMISKCLPELEGIDLSQNKKPEDCVKIDKLKITGDRNSSPTNRNSKCMVCAHTYDITCKGVKTLVRYCKSLQWIDMPFCHQLEKCAEFDDDWKQCPGCTIWHKNSFYCWKCRNSF